MTPAADADALDAEYGRFTAEATLRHTARVALPFLAPLYVLFSALDFMYVPRHGWHFLWVRLSALAVAGVVVLVAARVRGLRWACATVWVLTWTVSSQLAYMAHVTGPHMDSVYLQSANLLAGAMLFFLPLPGRWWIVTIAIAYLPCLAVHTAHRIAHGEPLLSPLAILYAGGAAVFSFEMETVGRLRRKEYEKERLAHRLATTDSLTELTGRGVFLSRFVREISLLLRKKPGSALSFLLIDVDDFKGVNDRFGHLAGDRCLRLTAQAIRRSVRVYDVVGRFGGDEFVVLLPETGAEDARVVGERIVRAVAEDARGFEGPFTVTYGGASLLSGDPEGRGGIGSLRRLVVVKQMVRMLRAADERLYQGKRARGAAAPAPAALTVDPRIADEERDHLETYLRYFDELPDETGAVSARSQGKRVPA